LIKAEFALLINRREGRRHAMRDSECMVEGWVGLKDDRYIYNSVYLQDLE
jgi:hypothetical protein